MDDRQQQVLKEIKNSNEINKACGDYETHGPMTKLGNSIAEYREEEKIHRELLKRNVEELKSLAEALKSFEAELGGKGKTNQTQSKISRGFKMFTDYIVAAVKTLKNRVLTEQSAK